MSNAENIIIVPNQRIYYDTKIYIISKIKLIVNIFFYLFKEI